MAAFLFQVLLVHHDTDPFLTRLDAAAVDAFSIARHRGAEACVQVSLGTFKSCGFCSRIVDRYKALDSAYCICRESKAIRVEGEF